MQDIAHAEIFTAHVCAKGNALDGKSLDAVATQNLVAISKRMTNKLSALYDKYGNTRPVSKAFAACAFSAAVAVGGNGLLNLGNKMETLGSVSTTLETNCKLLPKGAGATIEALAQNNPKAITDVSDTENNECNNAI